MAVYSDTKELYSVMEALWLRIKSDPKMSEPLLKSKMAVQFQYRDPAGKLTIDCRTGKDFVIVFDEFVDKPTVEMSMKSDVAHQFWLGKINVAVALLTGQIVAKGPVDKALALLPVIKPAYAIYPEVFEKRAKKSG